MKRTAADLDQALEASTSATAEVPPVSHYSFRCAFVF